MHFLQPYQLQAKVDACHHHDVRIKRFVEPIIDHGITNPSDCTLTDTQKLKIIYGVASAMSYLHGHGILHCDLKPDNILLEEFLFPKVSDSGLSKSDTSDVLMKTTAGEVKRTPSFIAPEIWMNSEYSKAGDVYSFSIVVFEMITCTRAIDDSWEASNVRHAGSGSVQVADHPLLDAKPSPTSDVHRDRCGAPLKLKLHQPTKASLLTISGSSTSIRPHLTLIRSSFQRVACAITTRSTRQSGTTPITC